MLTGFQWFSLIIILAGTFAGGFMPLLYPERARQVQGFPMGQAFSAGVFLALSLTMMLPSAFHLFSHAFPKLDFPVASVITISAFLLLLFLEHAVDRLRQSKKSEENGTNSPIIPVIMTFMIAVPSFFLGAALSVSNTEAAVFILIAILAHKSSAGFALALKMVRSTLSRTGVFGLFIMFACATPAGIIVGEHVHAMLGAHAMAVVKGFVLAVAAGVFLYMSTLHELKETPLIVDCCHRKGFAVAVSGFVLTALVRLLIGEAHRLGG
jgi:solute carrier family 39 (zinc transporter), member 1/2/3